MSSLVHVVGHGWRDGRVHLRVREGDAVVERPIGPRMRFQVTEERRCIGYADGVDRRPCPTGELPGRHQCPTCERRDAWRPCITCDGSRCPTLHPDVDRACKSTHHLYIACFGDPRLKIGTASDHRKVARIVEQGPLAAARIAAGPGPTIKQMESRLSREGFVEAMRRDKKRALLQSVMTLSEARAHVLGAVRGVREILPAAYHAFLHDPEFVPQPDLALYTRERLDTAEPLPLAPGDLVEGRVVGAVGHVVVLEEEVGRFLLDLGALVTCVIDVDPSGPVQRPKVQMSLF